MMKIVTIIEHLCRSAQFWGILCKLALSLINSVDIEQLKVQFLRMMVTTKRPT